MPEKEHVIVGTAGHIDHGKSSLVKALTGIDPDTLPEEKERGLTIELGFVFLEAPGYEKQIVFIDVPGHEKFIKTMAAGASSIDAVILVIAADEGICVQTREHFDILQLLGVDLGMVALTKADLVSPDQILELTFKIKDFVKGTFLEGAPIVPVSSVTRQGIDEIKAALITLGRRVKKRPDSGVLRMPIDRVFSIHGFGTVIAGTILSGEVRVGDALEIYPEGLEVRVRGIQVHNEKKEYSSLGKRTAINLQDVKKELLRRGQCAAAPKSLKPTIRLDARLNLLKSYGQELRNRERIRLNIGTDEVIARLVLLEKGSAQPGESSLAQFICEASTVALPGDRFVVRSFSPLMTIGGGIILEGAAEKHKREDSQVIEALKKLEGSLREFVEQIFIEAGCRPRRAQDVAIRAGKNASEVKEAIEELQSQGKLVQVAAEQDGMYIHHGAYAKLSENLLSAAREYFETYPHRLFMPVADLRSHFLKMSDALVFKVVLEDLFRKKLLLKKEAGVGLVGHEAKFRPRDQEAADRIERIYRSARYESPLEEEVEKQLDLKPALFKSIVGSLIQQGNLVRLSAKVTYHRDTVEAARTLVLNHLQKHKSIGIAELRDRLRISRKYGQAILEYFDRIGLTKRIEDRHVLR